MSHFRPSADPGALPREASGTRRCRFRVRSGLVNGSVRRGGESQEGSGIGVRGLGNNQAVRGDGGRVGVVGRATATAVDGRGVGGGTFGVVGVGSDFHPYGVTPSHTAA